jgi:hypothetical protein
MRTWRKVKRKTKNKTEGEAEVREYVRERIKREKERKEEGERGWESLEMMSFLICIQKCRTSPPPPPPHHRHNKATTTLHQSKRIRVRKRIRIRIRIRRKRRRRIRSSHRIVLRELCPTVMFFTCWKQISKALPKKPSKELRIEDIYSLDLAVPCYWWMYKHTWRCLHKWIKKIIVFKTHHLNCPRNS